MSDPFDRPADVARVDHDARLAQFDALSGGELLEALVEDFIRAWRRGESIPAEAYLRSASGLHTDPEVALDLVVGEVMLRRERGERPILAEYTERFPQLAGPLKDHFELERLLESESTAGRVIPDDPAHTESFDIRTLMPPGSGGSTGGATLPGKERFAGEGRADDDGDPDVLLRATSVRYFGDYELRRVLGRGGMGVVYKARQRSLNRLVALKMIRADRLAGDDERRRFRNEAEAVAQLDHPHIVPIYEVGEYDGRPYFAMKLVAGSSLATRLDAYRDDPSAAARLMVVVAEAVHHAHQRAILHRDLKPANILLDEAGQPHVVDFGLAKRLAGEGDSTQSGALLGTPAFMAPEQASGRRGAVTTAADVYGLGAVLYALLTGGPPFRGDDVAATLEAVRDRPPERPSQGGRRVPRDLEVICLKCLEKDSRRCYGSAAAMAEDLRRWQAGRPIAARPVGSAESMWRWSRRNPALSGLGGLVLALLIALTVGSAWATHHLRSQLDSLNRERFHAATAERGRLEAVARSSLRSLADGVPVLAEQLRPARRQVLPILRAAFAAGQGNANRLRAAVVLTLLGEDHSEYLMASIPTAPTSESRNVLLALSAVGSGCVRPLRAAFSAARHPEIRARYASSLLALGEVDAARSMLASGIDPAERAAFIHHFVEWHGDFSSLPKLLRRSEDRELQCGICTALGRIAPDRITEPERSALGSYLGEACREAPDGGIRAAAGWTLRRWGLALPEIAQAPGDQRRGWSVNELGMTMVELPLEPFPGRDVLMLPFAISTCEATSEQFRRFLDDPRTPAAGKPLAPMISAPVAPDLPVGVRSWGDAVLFCNWLSLREGRTPCYVQAGAGPSGWRCRFEASGYRLPTRAEWEYATRAGSPAAVPTGPSTIHIADYANFNTEAAEPVGSRAPNRWGLFDLQGNHWEYCWDSTLRFPAGAVHPVGRVTTDERLIAGGGFESGTFGMRIGVMYLDPVNPRASNRGFRVVCVNAQDVRGLLDPEAAERQIEYLRKLSRSRPDAVWIQRALDRVVRDAVPLIQELESRAREALKRGDPALAARALTRILDIWPDRHDAWCDLAPLWIDLGDYASYRRHRRLMLDRFGATKDPTIAERTAKACLLEPGPIDPGDRAVGLAALAEERGRGHPFRPFFDFVRALADYRTGRPEEALRRLEEALRYDDHPLLPIMADLVAAMARQQLGERERAQMALARAVAALDDRFSSPDRSGLETIRHDWWACCILRREAEGVVLLAPVFPARPEEVFVP